MTLRFKNFLKVKQGRMLGIVIYLVISSKVKCLLIFEEKATQHILVWHNVEEIF